MAIGYGVPAPKGRPRVLDRVEQKRALEKQERDCRRVVDARDHRQCFFPTCRAFAGHKHHIQPRSLGGRWQTFNILSACQAHHRWFKAGLIRVCGNPDDGPVTVQLTTLGKDSGLTIPKAEAA